MEKVDIQHAGISADGKILEYNFLQVQEERYKINANGADFLNTPTAYGTETIFIKKRFQFTLKQISCEDSLKMAMVKDANGAVFESNEVGSVLKLDAIKVRLCACVCTISMPEIDWFDVFDRLRNISNTLK